MGVLFQKDFLLDMYPEKDRKQATKRDRTRKWAAMIRHGLDLAPAEKVIDKNLEVSNGNTVSAESDKEMMPYPFTNYARIGLRNFYRANPQLFLSRLAKGPPPQYRWLAWSFIAAQLKPKVKGDYTKHLILGQQPENPCIRDIEKDINRSFPHLYYFRDEGQSAWG